MRRMGAHSALLRRVSAMIDRTRVSSLEKTWKSTSFSSKGTMAKRKRLHQGATSTGFPRADETSAASPRMSPEDHSPWCRSAPRCETDPRNAGMSESVGELVYRGVLLHASSVRSLAGGVSDPALLRQDRRDGAFGRGSSPCRTCAVSLAAHVLG